MKKILGLMLIILLVSSMLLTGCSGSDSATEEPQQQSEQTEPSGDAAEEADAAKADTEGMGDLLSATYVDMMKNNEYFMKYKATIDYNGQSTEMEASVAVKGDDMAMTSTMQGTDSNLVIKDDKVYMVDHIGKTVTTWAQPEGAAAPMDSGTIDTEGITYIGSGKEDGLIYEEYSTALDGNVKYYFDGKELVKIAFSTEDNTMVMEILEMSKNVPADMFEIPGGYQVNEM